MRSQPIVRTHRTRCAVVAATVAVAAAVSSLSHVACTGQASPRNPSVEAAAAAKPPLTPELLEVGHRLYERQCAVCHGATGAGDGPAAYLLYPKPRDFTQNEFRLVSTNSLQATDEDLFLTITRGMPGSSMPSWETLTSEERWALVYYVRQLTGVSEPVDQASAIQVPPETPTTPEGVARGRDIFAQACASCHGPQGRGDGQQVMADNLGYPVRPRDLTAGVFKGSSESKDLYYRIVAGLPGSPMPSYAGAYTDEQLWDLIHYVQSLVPPEAGKRVRLRRQTIQARRVRGELPNDPSAEIWNTVQPVYVAVTPLWWRDQRIEGLDIKALHNGQALAFHLSWDDPTRDDSLVGQQAFSDGVAAQLSTEPEPPFFGMGGLPAPRKSVAASARQAGDHGAVAPPPAYSPEANHRPGGPNAGGGVEIWHWKAAWQKDLAGWQDIETAYPDAAVDWYPGQRDYRHGEAFEVRDAKTTSQDPERMAGWGAGNPLSTPERTSAAEEAAAKGLGTLTSRPLPAPRKRERPEARQAGLPVQRVQATGEWREGRWRVVLRRPFDPRQGGVPPRAERGTRREASGVEGQRPLASADKDDLALRPGQTVSVAFAVWDGEAEDRDGQKSVSIWNTLHLER